MSRLSKSLKGSPARLAFSKYDMVISHGNFQIGSSVSPVTQANVLMCSNKRLEGYDNLAMSTRPNFSASASMM
ncbi:MAG: hypothetical protein WBO10_00755 [Pyrinomonadaceae bacterium]